MTRQEIENEVIATRFNANYQSRIREWVKLAYAKVWGFADWPFKYDTDSVTVTASDPTPTYTATDVAKILKVADEDGMALKYLSKREFDLLYESTTDTGSPEHYKLDGRSITLGPIPDSSETFSMTYMRRVPDLADDTDEPEFDSEFHYALVFGATAIGLKLENDPTFDIIEQEFISLLGQMREHYLPDHIGETHSFAGPDTWY